MIANVWVFWLLLSTSMVSKDVQFELVNSTTYTFSKVWLAKHETGVWGINLVGQPVKPGDKIEIRRLNKGEWQLWDLRVQYAPKKYEQWTDGFDLLSIYQIEIQLTPNGKWNAHYLFKKP